MSLPLRRAIAVLALVGASAVSLPVGLADSRPDQDVERAATPSATPESTTHRGDHDAAPPAPQVGKAASGGQGKSRGKGPKGAVPEAAAAEPRVIVAVVDDPTNPYHEFFHAPERSGAVTSAVLAELGVDAAHTISLTRTGDYEADVAADSAQFDAVQPGELYWFEGTNVLSITFDPGDRPLLPDSDATESHGIGTSSAVLTANPESIVVLVEGITAESETWAFTHPSVDIISTSYGLPGSLPVPVHLTESYGGVVEQGKIHVGAADNSPALSWPDGTSGPWWSIGVSGYYETTAHGRENLSGTFPDFLSDFGQDLPYCACESGTEFVYGTSFATPRTAGTISSVLLAGRRAVGHTGGIDLTGDVPAMITGEDVRLTNWQIRRALEEAAYVPALEEWDPVSAVLEFGATPINPIAPYLQVAWGVVTPDPAKEVIPQALAGLGLGSVGELREKSQETCDFMTANMEVRHLYWDQVALLSESFGTSADPYVYC